MYRSLRQPLLALLLALFLSGCGSIGEHRGGGISSAVSNAPFVYHSPVQQGNVITQEMVNQLRPGMERNQVRFILGTPTLIDPFREDRWDYLYSLRQGTKVKQNYRFTVFFENDRLHGYSGDFRPDLNAPPIEREQLFVVP